MCMVYARFLSIRDTCGNGTLRCRKRGDINPLSFFYDQRIVNGMLKW